MKVSTLASSSLLLTAPSSSVIDAQIVADFSAAAEQAAKKMQLGQSLPTSQNVSVSDNWQCPDQCNGDCGKNAGWCEGSGGGCTPYPWWPNRQNQDVSWMYTGQFNQQAFLDELEGENAYQAYQSPGDGDYWIVHGNDGSGVQTDCLGDPGAYLEHFDNYGVDNGNCDWENTRLPYASWNQCSFYHRGKEEWWGDYQCGWWRGFDKAWDASLYNAWKHIGISPPADDANWFDNAMVSLRNCNNCANGDASMHTFTSADTQPDYWFVGSLSPWVCRNDGPDGDMWGFTDTAGENCYCDNEPWLGRDGTNVPNWNTMFLYCGKNDGDRGMTCDLIKFAECMGKDENKWCYGAEITNKGFWVDATDF